MALANLHFPSRASPYQENDADLRGVEPGLIVLESVWFRVVSNCDLSQLLYRARSIRTYLFSCRQNGMDGWTVEAEGENVSTRTHLFCEASRLFSFIL